MAATQHHLVNAQLGNERRYLTTATENISAIIQSIGEAAQSMQTYNYSAGVEGAKAACLSLLQAEQDLSTLTKAAQDIQLGYQPPESHTDETNFAELLQAATDRHSNADYNPEESVQYKAFVSGIDQDGEGGDANAMDEDGDLHMERGNELAPNRTCPLSMVEILEIEDPVEDSLGFVYEKKHVEEYIRKQPGGVTIAPTAGATHNVRIADLKPARKVIRAQRRARLQPTQTQLASADDVLDVV